jgi:cyclophilin family peptidyl-prolyl cis-trans isomerase
MTRQYRNRVSRFLRQRRSHRNPRPFRLGSFEPLESRLVLANPTLAAIANVNMYSGMPMYIALDGNDSDGDSLSYTVSSSNGSLTGSVPEGNHSLRMTVEGYGVMEFELFEDGAPRTTARIMELVNSGFYDGLTFHRIIKGFMIQGGDPEGDGTGGSGADFNDEFNPDLLHSCAGVLSMAKSTDDTNDSQFFITSTATPHLDYQHSVFGFLTKGDSVRKAIESVAVNSSVPITPVVIDSMEIFADYENGALVLKAADGFTGTANVTVTVNDGHGGTAQRTFQVTVAAPPAPTTDYSRSYMSEIGPITIRAGESYNFTIPGHDPDGHAIYYSAQLATASSAVTVSTSSTTGATTLTTTSAAAGVYMLKLRVASSLSNLAKADSQSYYHDTQYVPVYVTSDTPPTIELLTSSDTGLSTSDNITSLDNTAGKALGFLVKGVVKGAKVELYVDGGTTPIGETTVSGSTGQVIVTTNGTVDLNDGPHSFRVVHIVSDSGVEIDRSTSEALGVTIDTSAPQFTSSAPRTAVIGRAYVYDARTNEEENHNVRYTLTKSVAGMTVDETTGAFTWTPGANQIGTQEITLRATDLAGQYVEQSFHVTVGEGPLVTTVADQHVREGETVSLTVEAEDTLLPLVYSLDDAPDGATIDAETGAFTWTTGESDGPADHTITVAVTNSEGKTSRMVFTVTVDEVNTEPQLNPIDNRTVAERHELGFKVDVTDTDIGANGLANTLEFSLVKDSAVQASTGTSPGRPRRLRAPASTRLRSWSATESAAEPSRPLPSP